MAKNLVLVKYTPETCAALATEGFASRQAAVTTALEATGGKLLDFWAVNSTDWHVAFVAENAFDAAQNAAGAILNYGVGHIEDLATYELADVGSADDALSALSGRQVSALGTN